jgi:hypothetical protein
VKIFYGMDRDLGWINGDARFHTRMMNDGEQQQLQRQDLQEEWLRVSKVVFESSEFISQVLFYLSFMSLLLHLLCICYHRGLFFVF